MAREAQCDAEYLRHVDEYYEAVAERVREQERDEAEELSYPACAEDHLGYRPR